MYFRSQNFGMTLEHLEDLFLRPQATEASYKFIEQLIIDRITAKIIGAIPGKDSLVDLLYVYTKMVTRAGSGWIVVKSRRIVRRIIVPILCMITTIDQVTDEVIGALVKLLSASSVLFQCEKDMIILEITRILRLAQVPSVNLWRIVRSGLIADVFGAIETQLIISVALANVAISRTGHEAASCMEVLSMLMPWVTSNSQMLSTTLGLAQRSASQFADDQEVRRLAADIIRKSSDLSHITDRELPVLVESTVEEVESRQIVEALVEDAPQETTVESPDHQPVEMDSGETGAFSPRSSCPSLDL